VTPTAELGEFHEALDRPYPLTREQIGFLSEALADLCVEESGFPVGEVSFHAGWTFHRAGANLTGRPRAVMTVIYMDEGIRLAEPTNRNQVADRHRWRPGVQVGDVIASPLNPVVYSAKSGPPYGAGA
jgi:hypothetical protein